MKHRFIKDEIIWCEYQQMIVRVEYVETRKFEDGSDKTDLLSIQYLFDKYGNEIVGYDVLDETHCEKFQISIDKLISDYEIAIERLKQLK